MKRHRRVAFVVLVLLIGLLIVIVVPLARIMSAPAPVDYTPDYLRPEEQQTEHHLTALGYWQTSEFHGRYYNIDADGQRRVLGQPIRYTHTLWIFGNSGTYDPYVPDSATMATDLQLLFDRHGYAVRVINRSTSAQHISGELAWLKLTHVARGDTVVFVDGWMDYGTSERNASLITAAHRYATSISATFYHFVQASSEPVPDAIPVPLNGFVEGVHLNAYGDSIVARYLFDAITTL